MIVQRRARPVHWLLAISWLLAACDVAPSPSPSPSLGPEPTPSPSIAPTSAAPAPPSAAPTATPAPTLALELPESTDPRRVSVVVTPQVTADGGQITVAVTHLGDVRIDELVLRWPTALDEVMVLAPFVPSAERIREGGQPLSQPWTKWVIGPGEQGEPAGTTSLGYGPLLPGSTLSIPLFVTRGAPGPVAFDLQVLAANDLLALDGGEPAELRVEVP